MVLEKWLIGVEAGRLLRDQRYRGTMAKDIKSCDNAFVTNILLLSLRCTHAFAQKTSVGPRAWSEAKRLIERPQEALLCAKAKRQQQSAQPERKSTSRFAKEHPPFMST